MTKPTIFTGGFKSDERGTVRYVNDFSLSGIKRFYELENVDNQYIRAWHGHLKEAKYVFVPCGKALVCVVPLDDPVRPNPKASVSRFILDGDRPAVLFIPPGYANGFRDLGQHSRVIFFATASLEESLNDDYRFPVDYWDRAVWQLGAGE